MRTYKLESSWSYTGVLEVEARSLEEAIERAHEHCALPDGVYVDDSFAIDALVVGENDDDVIPIDEALRAEELAAREKAERQDGSA